MTFVQDFYKVYLRMKDSTLEIISEQEIASTTDMKNRPCKLLKLNVHKISHRIILYETARLHLHPEGIHLRQILIILRLYHTSFSL